MVEAMAPYMAFPGDSPNLLTARQSRTSRPIHCAAPSHDDRATMLSAGIKDNAT
jgi:hypothetical protein